MITYDDYLTLGYSKITAEQFGRYEAMATAIAVKYTFGRLTSDTATETNKRGVCELMDCQYYLDNVGYVTSFSNGAYSESYNLAHQNAMAVNDIIEAYFTPEQLYRGV